MLLPIHDCTDCTGQLVQRRRSQRDVDAGTMPRLALIFTAASSGGECMMVIKSTHRPINQMAPHTHICAPSLSGARAGRAVKKRPNLLKSLKSSFGSRSLLCAAAAVPFSKKRLAQCWAGCHKASSRRPGGARLMTDATTVRPYSTTVALLGWVEGVLLE